MKRTLSLNNIVLIIVTSLLCITIIVLSATIKSIVSTKQDNSSSKEDSELLVKNTGTRIYKSENENFISYIVEDYDRGLTYTWQFKKDEEYNRSVAENIELNVNLRLSIDADTEDTRMINDLVNQKKLIISFDHVGKLPSKATVRINVSDRFNDGDKLYLYYYNPTNKKIEFIKDNIKVIDGYIEFEIDHCSDYLLTGAVVNEAVGNPKHVNYVIIGLIVVVIILIAKNLWQSRR